MTAGMRALIETKRIVVCCGSGGVGKTTSAAALAVEGALAGRKSCVVTIDPAKRLADALGIESLTNQPHRIDGDWPGELWALMLDTKGTFDELVHRYASTPEQGRVILDNRLYRNISGALSGTQEYMAMEKLYELHHGGVPGIPDFDLVVVDTPPTRNALDFLDAPRRLTAFLDNRIFRLLITPTRAYLKAVSVATHAFLKTVSRVIGAEVVGDAMAFFTAFEGMEAGFRDRAQAVRDLLAAPETAFVLVTSPRPDAVEEASYFAAKLTEAGIAVDALVVNRLHPRFGGPADSPAGATPGSAIDVLRANLAAFREVASGEEAHFEKLAQQVAPAAVRRVPVLAGDVHDLDGLRLVGTHLVEDAVPTSEAGSGRARPGG
ncbi:MAG: ArsA family ATPase [Acidimicrobiales bacterium]